MGMKNELFLACDGPKCKQSIIAGVKFIDMDDKEVFDTEEDLYSYAFDSDWYKVDMYSMENTLWFHEVNCLKRYFRENFTNKK